MSRRERPSTQSSAAKPGRQRYLILGGKQLWKWTKKSIDCLDRYGPGAVWWVNIFVHLNIWGYQPPARRARPDELLDQDDQDENDHQCYQCYQYFETWVVISVMIVLCYHNTNHHFLISWLLCFQHYHFNHFDKTGQPPWTQQKGQGGRPLLAFMQRYIFSLSGVGVSDT